MENGIDKIRSAMTAYFGNDLRRVDHAMRVAGYAETLLRSEPGNPEIVLAAAYLHDIGIHESERKYGSTAGNLQEIEGPPIAREILSFLGYESAFIDEVCDIIGSHHSPGEVETDNFRIIWDADWLVNVGDELDLEDKDNLRRSITRIFMTSTGKELAKEIYLDASIR